MEWIIMRRALRGGEPDIYLVEGSRSSGAIGGVNRTWAIEPAAARRFATEQEAAQFIVGEFSQWQIDDATIQPTSFHPGQPEDSVDRAERALGVQ